MWISHYGGPQIVDSWRWRLHGSPKSRYLTRKVHGVTYQKTSTWVQIGMSLTHSDPVGNSQTTTAAQEENFVTIFFFNMAW